MRVIATAGHVDHGKSTLIRRLTGMEPDRWAEEHRRGLTIDLGFAWTDLPGGPTAFVDVPGHERFTANMLAGVGPVPAVMFVVAADEGWMPQSAEHLAALDALGVRHGLLVVTRCDLADPAPATRSALAEIAATGLGAVRAVAVSGRTGAGTDLLRAELDALADGLPAPDPNADVRLWVDRSFTVRGAGTVVTGTLGAGTVRAGDELVLSATGERVRVRGLEALGRREDSVGAVARVAVNLRGVDRERVGRGDALLTPDAWVTEREVDVRLRRPAGRDEELPRNLVLHLGSAAVPAHVRPLGTDTARLVLARPLPLRAGDRGLLRDPGRHRVAAGVVVLDARPPALRRRGAAAHRAEELSGDVAAAHLRARGLVRAGELRALGFPVTGVAAGGWQVDPGHWESLVARVPDELEAWLREHPLDTGVGVDALAHRFDVPAEVLALLAAAAGATVADGRVRGRRARAELPPHVEKAVRAVEDDLAAAPFTAPDAQRLADLGLGRKEIAAAVRAERLVRVAEGVVLGPDAAQRAARVLAGLPSPFTASEAKRALGTTRRVAVPLLEHLDALRLTRRLPDDTRVLTG
jgi:selenocysteine-specific elongation factor